MQSKNIVITGGSGGLGSRLARKFSVKGETVILLGTSREKLERVSNELPNKNYTYQLDIASSEEVKNTFQSIYSKIGKVDILINCAGVGKFDVAEKLSAESVNRMIDVNLKGTVFCTQEVLGKMKEENSGQIINIISMSGKRAKHSEAIYSASKFGVTGFTQGVSLELEETNVNIMGIYMGNMATELWEGDKAENVAGYIDPDDMAEIIMQNTEPHPNLSIEELVVKNTPE